MTKGQRGGGRHVLPTLEDEDELREWLDEQAAGAPADSVCNACE